MKKCSLGSPEKGGDGRIQEAGDGQQYHIQLLLLLYHLVMTNIAMENHHF